MACLKITKSQDIIDCILSIDDNFYCNDYAELVNLLSSIGFIEHENIYDKKYTLFWFEGRINDTPVDLEFYQAMNESKCILTEKHFFKLIDNHKIKHRDTDLPNVLIYDMHENHSIRMLKYHKNGDAKRNNNLDAPFIYFEDNRIKHIYSMITDLENDKNTIRLKSITCQDNNIINIEAYYCESIFSLKQMITIIPRLEHFNFKQMANLKNELTYEENILLNMIYI